MGFLSFLFPLLFSSSTPSLKFTSNHQVYLFFQFSLHQIVTIEQNIAGQTHSKVIVAVFTSLSSSASFKENSQEIPKKQDICCQHCKQKSQPRNRHIFLKCFPGHHCQVTFKETLKGELLYLYL